MADSPSKMSWRDKFARIPKPDLGRRVGSPAWFAQIAVLVLLVGGAVAISQIPSQLGVKSATLASTPETPAFNTPEITVSRDEAVAPSSFWLETWDNSASVVVEAAEASVEESFEAGDLLDEEIVEAAPVPELIIKTDKVGRGESLAIVLRRAGLSNRENHLVIQALSENLDMRRIRQGQIVEFAFDPEDETRLMQVRLQPDEERIVYAERDGDSFSDRLETIALDRATIRAEGRISDSLYMAARRSLLPHEVIVELIHIYSFDVDFQREIRPGDRFEVYYEHYLNESGVPVKNGRILYANLTIQGKSMDLYRYIPTDDERPDYFAPDGQSARKALLRTPVDGARLTSGFGARKHPILGYTRMHKGLDFGARTGTPIRAAGDGVIERASRYGGYGNYIRIRHNGTYKTAYAHLHGYASGIRAGVRVQQGQIIGYVGSTGRSTGPHLHYEVLKDGTHVNPMKLKMPSGRKLDGEQFARFKQTIEQVQVEMASAPLTTQLASRE